MLDLGGRGLSRRDVGSRRRKRGRSLVLEYLIKNPVKKLVAQFDCFIRDNHHVHIIFAGSLFFLAYFSLKSYPEKRPSN